MSDAVVASILGVVVAPLVGVLVLWLRKRLRLSEEAAAAVEAVAAPDSTRAPASVDGAIAMLASKLAIEIAARHELELRLAAHEPWDVAVLEIARRLDPAFPDPPPWGPPRKD